MSANSIAACAEYAPAADQRNKTASHRDRRFIMELCGYGDKAASSEGKGRRFGSGLTSERRLIYRLNRIRWVSSRVYDWRGSRFANNSDYLCAGRPARSRRCESVAMKE